MVHITQSPAHARIRLRGQRAASLRRRHGLPRETFGMLKEKEIRLYGEYRTSRLVLEAWDRLE